MRLSESEIHLIRSTIRAYDKNARIFLHGSRTDPKLRGGDIDLVVHSSTLEFSDKISLIAELKEKLGDQKIDLTLISPDQLPTDPFWLSISAHALEI